MSKIIVVGELRNNVLRNVSFEAITAAKQWQPSSEVVAVLINADEAAATDMIQYGADRAILLQGPNQELTAEVAAKVILNVIQAEQPTGIILGHTSLGKDVAPRLAARLQAGLVSDVVKIEGQDDDAKFIRPIYSGKAFEKAISKTETVLVTVRPNNFSALEKNTSRSGEVAVENVEFTDVRVQIREILRKASTGVDLSEANIIVSGGRGVKGKEGFELLQKLANAVGGAVGASRGACDAGYCDYALQIGQTGKVVTPDLYIACGISGAIQHIAGMSNSKVIVAINKDPEANIFSIADYGIVGDLFEVVPILIEEFQKVKVS
ncbi:electron transfer flavoprotein subunit alpha/FixB family protein [Lysinibacillus endophyticus]|uniref:electron transfer flavoprotein subunit alpha/FixB family protein n=1 Tax=Ureibacillus endophyticus TaxID=1978490 RepID=UPI00209E32FA|nr:electron transfer flavoprotein subunit alpha/FixB family protein [Lysinibacillus endophyticus]MCP1146676.1 electron transfer flavoprotein subunit alpha/FixB family protein [Lysinibacillus endophyticus]